MFMNEKMLYDQYAYAWDFINGHFRGQAEFLPSEYMSVKMVMEKYCIALILTREL